MNSSKTLSIIAAALTALLLIVIATLFLFVEVIALNGASERQGLTAIMLSLICQGIGVILASILAAWLARLLHEKFSWHSITAVIVAVIAGTSFGALLAFLSTILSIPIAGIG